MVNFLPYLRLNNCMFTSIDHTDYPPSKPLFLWDGKCGFCQFWKIYWDRRSEGRLVFEPFQNAATQFKDIPEAEFAKASRLIEPDGKVYSGPNSAYRSFTYFKNGTHFWHNLYERQRWFRFLSDHGYIWIAKNRAFMFRVTKLMFGKNPRKLKYYWVYYILALVMIICLFTF